MSEPAFPQGHMDGPHINPSGLTKLEYFTAAAMQGLLANGAMLDGTCRASEQQVMQQIAEDATAVAQATLAQLAKEEGR